jgi:hypothetical protein
MVKSWKLNNQTVVVTVRDEARLAAALAATGLEDHCLTSHESQFHIEVRALHKFARALRLSSADQTALRQTCPGSDLIVTVPDLATYHGALSVGFA